MRPYVSPSTPQRNQCEMSHFLAGEGACNLMLHIHVVVNWQLSKQGIRSPVSRDRIASSGVDPSRLRVFEGLRWQVSRFQWIAGSTRRGFFWKGYKLIIRKKYKLWTGASPLALAKFIWYRIHIVCYILLLFYFSLTKGSKFLIQDLC